MGVILTPTMARTKLLLVLLAVGVYAGTPPVYVFFRVRAASLRREEIGRASCRERVSFLV